MRISKLENFINNAKKIHKNKYEYLKTLYGRNNREKVIITCPKHGDFLQKPCKHLVGQGCPKCSGKNRTTQEIIEKFRGVYNNKYDYSKVTYLGLHKKVCIICKIHGKFFQTPNNHLRNRQCPLCSEKRRLENIKKRRHTKKDVLSKFRNVHGTKYDYSKFVYHTYHKKGKIICLKHGLFWQNADKHIRGEGCPKCVHRISKPEEEFLNYLKIPNTPTYRQLKIYHSNVDGYDKNTNTIYEFLGDYYHGNPKKFKLCDYNETCNKTFGELYYNTFEKFRLLKNLGYNIKYVWESDWKKFIKKETNILNLIEI